MLSGPAAAELSPGTKVVASVLTFEPLAYQVKGEVATVERSLGQPTAIVAVQEVYSASAPLPDQRIA